MHTCWSNIAVTKAHLHVSICGRAEKARRGVAVQCNPIQEHTPSKSDKFFNYPSGARQKMDDVISLM